MEIWPSCFCAVDERIQLWPSFSTIAFAWFPCSSVGTHMVCIPTLEHGNEKTAKRMKKIQGN
jgi:hypothetical protein